MNVSCFLQDRQMDKDLRAEILMKLSGRAEGELNILFEINGTAQLARSDWTYPNFQLEVLEQSCI